MIWCRIARVVLILLLGGLTASCASLARQPGSTRATSEALAPAFTPAGTESRSVVGRAGAGSDALQTGDQTSDPAGRSLVYGSSVENRPLVAYRFGSGPIARALIGGIHGGYEWNTTSLMSKTLEHLAADPHLIPPDLTLYVIPLVNPDGAAAGADRVEGRMNANGVDLNRNWDYRWQPTATHGSWPVSAGAHPFSEPETAALRDFILDRDIEAAIFYHSAAAVVFSGAGQDTSETVALSRFIAAATGYRYAPEGVPGQVTTGNAIDWLSQQGIAAAEVELSTHEALDWEQNLRGILAFLDWNLGKTDDD